MDHAPPIRGPASAPSAEPVARRRAVTPPALAYLVAAGNRLTALAVQRMDGDSKEEEPPPVQAPTPAPSTNVFFKAVADGALRKIKASGLDPGLAGGIGSSTFSAAANTGRAYTEHDRKGQFLAPDEAYADTYAHGGKRMLRVTLPGALVARLTCLGPSECYADFAIPPEHLEYEYEKNKYRPLTEWSGDLEEVHDREFEPEEEFEDD